MNMVNLIKLIGSVSLGLLTYLMGGIDNLFISLLILICIDYITGILKGIYKKNFSLKMNIKGIIKKIGYLIVVILATIFDRIINDANMAIRTLVIYFFIANEAISILENWANMGLPLPKKLFEVFEKLKTDDQNMKNEKKVK